MKNPFEDNSSSKETPEIKILYSSFQHHLGHFLLISRINPDIQSIEQLQKGNEFLDKLLETSQNESLVSVLREIKNKINDIDINSKPDAILHDYIHKLLEGAGKEQKY